MRGGVDGRTNMKPIISAALTSLAVLGLMAGCSSDVKVGSTASTGSTLAPGGSTSPIATVPSSGSLPTDFTIPTAMIDQMIAQLESSGLKVDRPCIENLLKDAELRKLIVAANTPNADAIQKFVACFKQ
jgi:hypothetical protein